MPEYREEPTIAAAHALHLSEVCARWGVSAEDLFAGTGLVADELTDPKARVTVPMLEQLAARAGEPGIAFYLGLQVPVSAHGYVGFAAMASPTLGEALEVAVRFAPTRTDAIALR